MAVFIPRFLRHLRDVDETGVADGDSLTYDLGTETWVPGAGGGGGDVTDAVILAPASSARNVIQPTAGGVIAEIVKAHAAQSVDLMQWQTSAGGLLVSIDRFGGLKIDNTDTTAYSLEILTPGLTSDFGNVWQIVNGSGQQIFYMASNGYTTFQFDPGSGAVEWRAIGGPVGIYLDAFQGFAVTNGVAPAEYFWWVNPDGYEAVAANSEPADGDIQAGEVFNWYDAANGAAYFYRKGKTLDGTVVKTRTAMGATYATSGSGEALQRDIVQAAHGLVVGNVVRYNGTAFVKAQANSEANSEVVGIVATVADVNNFTLHYGGHITGLSGLTAGAVYYLDDDTAGLLTATEPSDVGDVSKPLLIADSTTTGYFVNFRGAIVAAGGDSVAESLFDANTVLKADSDDTPVALTMGASTILARLASGSIKAASVAEIVTLLGAYVSGGTDVALADGGTGASTAATARANLQSATRRTSGYQVGQYYVGECFATGGFGGTGPNGVGACYFVPFLVDVTTTFDRIGCYVTANGSAGSIVRMGIYNDNNGVPGTVLLDAGTVATDAGAPAIKAVTISQQLTPGVYWTAVVAQVAAPTVRRCLPFGTMQPMSSDFNGSAVTTSGMTGALTNNPSLAQSVANPTTCALRALSSP